MIRALSVACFVACLLLAGRARAADGALSETKLGNGLRVVVDENPRTPVVSVTVRYAVGAANDPDARNGLTELVMHMMARKTEHVPENGFDEVVDRAGGRSGFASNLDDTEFYAELPASALEKAFWLLSDQMGFFTPAVDAASIRRAVALLAAERGARVAGDPLGLTRELVPSELFPAGTPYRHVPRADDAVGLSALTPAEVDAFARKFFVPSNAVLVVSGDATFAGVVALAKKWFGDLRPGTPQPNAFAPIAPPTREVHIEVAARVERPVVTMSWVTPAEFAPGDAALDVVANILYGARITRLAWELIGKRGIAGAVHAQQSSHRRGSVFTIVATATPKHTAQELAAAIDDVLQTLETTDPTADDMEGALASALMDPTLSMESSLYRARTFARWATCVGTADSWQADMRRYDLDPARVRQAAARYLPRGHRVVVFVTPSKTAPVAGKLVGRTVR